jgi:putative flavoprotein involved in K+ transport
MQSKLDVLIIGSSQAGLAAAHYLQHKNISFLSIGKEKRIGEVWRSRYDSLVLFTPRWYSSLPGLPLNGDPNGYATKNEIADYLENYAAYFDLPIQLNTEVHSLTKDGENFKVTTNTGEYVASKVIVASGPFQKPLIPKFADTLSNEIYQAHTSEYVNPADLKEGSVLVVGVIS